MEGSRLPVQHTPAPEAPPALPVQHAPAKVASNQLPVQLPLRRVLGDGLQQERSVLSQPAEAERGGQAGGVHTMSSSLVGSACGQRDRRNKQVFVFVFQEQQASKALAAPAALRPLALVFGAQPAGHRSSCTAATALAL